MEPGPIAIASIDLRMHLWYLAGLGDQVIGLQLDFSGRLDEAVLRRATDLLLAEEPVLASRLELNADPPAWMPEAQPSADILCVVKDDAGFQGFRREGLHADLGPQVRLCLWRQNHGDRLLLLVTHQVTDASGVKAIAQHLARLYSRLEVEPGYQPSPVASRSRDVIRVMGRQPVLSYLRLALDVFRLKMALRLPPPLSAPSPLAQEEECAHLLRHLPKSRIDSLVEYGRAQGATLNDLFLSAFAVALSKDVWPDLHTSPLAATVDLRRWHLPEAEAGPICNFSSGEILSLKARATDFESTLSEVAGQMRRRKSGQIGLAMAVLSRRANPPRRLSPADVTREVAAMRRETPIAWFSNMGVLDKQLLSFAGLFPVDACLMPPVSAPPCLLVGLSSFEGAVTLALSVPAGRRANAEALLDAIVDVLPQL